MSIENTRTEIEKFFKILDANSLTKDRRNEPIERVTKIKINLQEEDMSKIALKEIIDEHAKKHPVEPDKKFLALMRRLAILELSFKAEELKHNFKLILDPEKINFDDDIEYGKLMGRVFDKLNLDADTRERLKDIFFINIRNSLSHGDYINQPNDFAFRVQNTNRDEAIHLTNEELFEKHNEINEIEKCFIEYVRKFDESQNNTLQDSEP